MAKVEIHALKLGMHPLDVFDETVLLRVGMLELPLVVLKKANQLAMNVVACRGNGFRPPQVRMKIV